MSNKASNAAVAATATATAIASTNPIRKKDARRIDKAIKHHVRAIQRRLHRLAALKKKEEHKLDNTKEPVTFCERTAIEERYAGKAEKQTKKLNKHVSHVRKLNSKLAQGGLDPVQVPKQVVQLLHFEPCATSTTTDTVTTPSTEKCE